VCGMELLVVPGELCKNPCDFILFLLSFSLTVSSHFETEECDKTAISYLVL
jgi:hypothetical protein